MRSRPRLNIVLIIIFGLHLPPLYAFGIPAAVFLLVGLIGVGMFKKAKRSKATQ
jgi:hypothetical protein